MKQIAVEVLPTRTIYDFEDGHVHVTLTFMTPSLPDDLDVLARPLTYLTWEVRSVNGADHAVSIYDSTSALLAVNSPEQKVEWGRETIGDLTALRAGTVDQTLLQPAGDDTRIDWGYVYAAASGRRRSRPSGAGFRPDRELRRAGNAPRSRRRRHAPVPPTIASRAWRSPSTWVASAPTPVSRHVMIAYDEIYAIKFLGQKLRPYWRRNGAGAGRPARGRPSAIMRAWPGVARRSTEELMADLTRAGGVRMRRWPRWRIARRWPAAGWRPTPTSSRCSSPRRTAATAASPRST